MSNNLSKSISEIPSKEEAEAALKTLLKFIGEEPSRSGLLKTPSRVIESYSEIFSGYKANIKEILETKFSDIASFNGLVSLKKINFTSFCEHHMLPITGQVDIAYLPDKYVVGISKLARIVDVFAKRLQIQEKMTAQIADALQTNLKPLGVAVKISASHGCMTIRGVAKQNSLMVTSHFTGIFLENISYQKEFLK